MCEHLDIRERYSKGRGRVSVCQDCGEILISFLIASGENGKQWDKAVSLAGLAQLRAERDALRDVAIAAEKWQETSNREIWTTDDDTLSAAVQKWQHAQWKAVAQPEAASQK